MVTTENIRSCYMRHKSAYYRISLYMLIYPERYIVPWPVQTNPCFLTYNYEIVWFLYLCEMSFPCTSLYKSSHTHSYPLNYCLRCIRTDDAHYYSPPFDEASGDNKYYWYYIVVLLDGYINEYSCHIVDT